MNRRKFHRTLTAACAFCLGDRASGQAVEAEAPDTGLANLELPTLGGMQFWADELCFHDWRLQRHVVTGHHRLLDGENVRHAWGSYAQCLNQLEAVKRERRLTPMAGTGVVVLHGLFRSAANMVSLARTLKLQGGYTVFNISYPSTRGTVADHAAQLHRVLTRLEGIEKLHLVAHSLGNIVIRHYWNDQTNPAQDRKPDPRIQRLVMLGPPNQGARLAEMLASNFLVGAALGPPGRDFACGWNDLAPRLATPTCEFGIIAGGRGQQRGYNPLLPEDNDLVVTVASTKLAGARDHLLLPVFHTTMMNDPAVKRAVLSFLKHGWFRSEADRQPL